MRKPKSFVLDLPQVKACCNQCFTGLNALDDYIGHRLTWHDEWKDFVAGEYEKSYGTVMPYGKQIL